MKTFSQLTQWAELMLRQRARHDVSGVRHHLFFSVLLAPFMSHPFLLFRLASCGLVAFQLPKSYRIRLFTFLSSAEQACSVYEGKRVTQNPFNCGDIGLVQWRLNSTDDEIRLEDVWISCTDCGHLGSGQVRCALILCVWFNQVMMKSWMHFNFNVSFDSKKC